MPSCIYFIIHLCVCVCVCVCVHDIFVHLLLHTCLPLGQTCMILISSLYEILRWRSGQEPSP